MVYVKRIFTIRRNQRVLFWSFGMKKSHTPASPDILCFCSGVSLPLCFYVIGYEFVSIVLFSYTLQCPHQANHLRGRKTYRTRFWKRFCKNVFQVPLHFGKLDVFEKKKHVESFSECIKRFRQNQSKTLRKVFKLIWQNIWLGCV